jgi:hypothetical protein
LPENAIADRDAKRHLVDFVQDRTFDPIMRAKPNDFPEHRRDKLKDVRQSTQSEIERFRNYDIASLPISTFRGSPIPGVTSRKSPAETGSTPRSP